MLGFGLGFLENIIDGEKVIGHGGYLPSFNSQLTMNQEKNIGIFITLNTESKDCAKICNELNEKIYEFFIENKKHNNKHDKSLIVNKNLAFDMNANRINGSYGSESYGMMDLTKIKSVLANCKVKCDEKGNLIVKYEGDTVNYKYVGNGLFYNERDNEYCKITEYNGKMIFSPGFADFEKIPDINSYLLYACLISLIVFIVSIVALLISIFKNRKTQEKQKLILKALLIALSLMIILYYVSNVMMAIKCMTAHTYIVINLIMPTIKIICYITLILTIAICLYIIKLCKVNKITFKNKIFYCLLVLFAIINISFMYVMNGFRII